MFLPLLLQHLYDEIGPLARLRFLLKETIFSVRFRGGLESPDYYWGPEYHKDRL